MRYSYIVKICLLILVKKKKKFVNVKSRLEAHGNRWLWGIESMASLRFSNIVFCVDASN